MNVAPHHFMRKTRSRPHGTSQAMPTKAAAAVATIVLTTSVSITRVLPASLAGLAPKRYSIYEPRWFKSSLQIPYPNLGFLQKWGAVFPGQRLSNNVCIPLIPIAQRFLYWLSWWVLAWKIHQINRIALSCHDSPLSLNLVYDLFSRAPLELQSHWGSRLKTKCSQNRRWFDTVVSTQFFLHSDLLQQW